MNRIIQDIVKLLFPDLCIGCGERLIEGEKFLCMKCLFTLPTAVHKVRDREMELAVSSGIDQFFSPFEYVRGGIMQEIIHHFKYHRQPEMAAYMGRYAASKLPASFLSKPIDAIIPVPLHHKKKTERGYNQAEELAKGVSEVLKVPVSEGMIVRNRYSTSQTRLKRHEKAFNVSEAFSLTNEASLEGKHLLVVDDVCTTGATLGAVLKLLRPIENVNISVFTLAMV